MNGTGSCATIVIVQSNLAVLELVDQALRDRGDLVFATRDPFEALDVVERVTVDVLILDDPSRDVEQGVARDLGTIQPRLRVIYLGPEPVALGGLREAVDAVLGR